MNAPAKPSGTTYERAVHRLRRALGPVDVAGGRALTGGLYNCVHLFELADGRRLVLKSAPSAEAPALTHERQLLGTETIFHRLAATKGVSVPTVLHYEPAGPDDPGEWLLLDFLADSTWSEVGEDLPADGRPALRHRLGSALARTATATGTRFGYPQPVPGLQGDTWREAFTGMMHAVLKDASRFGSPLPAATDTLAALPDRFADALDEVSRPALVHFDAWEGNVVLTRDGDGGWGFGGLIDGERAFFGDPLAELVGLDPLGAAEDDPDLMAGYRSVTSDLPTTTPAARSRLALYRIYLALIMRVESIPRAYGPEHSTWLRSWSTERITQQLAVLDRLAAGQRLPSP
ncbi:phosphotransferase family protein [Streptomyces pristinaespiralis]|uniref:phosphotransferase family protein n=1 Tax=Streptomyces pristinaespiralis TaxID=38300 RepID=UPI0038370E42